MATTTRNLDDAHSAVSWGAILAGSTASAAVTLVMVAFGIGVGFSVVSPWAEHGISAPFTIPAGIYLIITAMIPATIGGYLAGRLRSQWQTVHEHERYFRDSAHGFLVWALATIVCAAVLGGAVTHLLGGATAGLAPAVGVAADVAHKSAAAFSLWLVASMLAGALSASLAAIEGGNLRNSEWYRVDGTRRRS
jgi:Na+/proline symporter